MCCVLVATGKVAGAADLLRSGAAPQGPQPPPAGRCNLLLPLWIEKWRAVLCASGTRRTSMPR